MMKFLLLLFLMLSSLYAGEYKVLGIGAPCIDYIINIDESDLSEFNLKKGGWVEVDVEFISSLIQAKKPIFRSTGDCVSNTIKGLASLNVACALTGKVGKDPLADEIRAVFSNLGVTLFFTETATPTSQIACLITPDGERSFCAHIQIEKEMSEDDLIPSVFEETSLVYCEGYSLRNGLLLDKALQLSKKAGATTSLDLANKIIIEEFRERIWALLAEYTDILFVNEEEAFALTHLAPKEAAIFLKNFCSIVVVKIGDQGCWVCSDKGLFHSPATESQVVDTNGAGDLFASAFLYGFLEGYSLEKCAHFGNLVGSLSVAKYGAELPKEKWIEILRHLEEN